MEANGHPSHNSPLWEKVRRILASALDPQEKLLLIALADYGGQDGIAFPSQARLAADLSLKPRQVRNLIAGLTDKPQGKDKDGNPGPLGPGILIVSKKQRESVYQIQWQKLTPRPATDCQSESIQTGTTLPVSEVQTGNFQHPDRQSETLRPAIYDIQTGNPLPTNRELTKKRRTEKRTKKTPLTPQGGKSGGSLSFSITQEELSKRESVDEWITKNIPPPVSQFVRMKIYCCVRRAMKEGKNPTRLFCWLVREGIENDNWQVSDEDLHRGERNMLEWQKAYDAALARENGEKIEGESLADAIGKLIAPHVEDQFQEFWEACPKKESKGQALALWEQSKRLCESSKHKTADETPAQFLTRRMYDYAAGREMEDPTFTKTPASWLRDQCWDNELPSRVPTDDDLRRWTPHGMTPKRGPKIGPGQKYDPSTADKKNEF